jgi:hypothetical protein
MRITSFFLSLFIVMLAIGCSSPTVPAREQAILPTFTIAVDNIDRIVDMNLLMDGRSVQVVVPGTDMTANQLRQYFAVGIVNDPSYGWPSWCKCFVYKYFLATFKKQSDATVFSWVVTMEANGYDVPNAPPPKAIC